MVAIIAMLFLEFTTQEAKGDVLQDARWKQEMANNCYITWLYCYSKFLLLIT